jgi:hypothetical protein
MSDIFNVLEGVVRPSGVLLAIKEFKDIWKRDLDVKKLRALDELAYVFYMADWKSTYVSYGLEMEQQVGEDVFGDRNYKPDEIVILAISKYKELQRTPSLAMLDTARMALNSIQYYFDEITIKPTDTIAVKKAKADKFDLGKVMKSIKEMGASFDTINMIEAKIKKEEEELVVKIRGGGKVGVFENEAPWIKT